MEPVRSDPTSAIVLVDGKKQLVPSSVSMGKKKKRGAMSFLRAALFIWRKRSGPTMKSNPALQIEVATASVGMLNKVVGSMRPLHAQGGESPVHLPAPPAAEPQCHPESIETPVLIHPSPSRSDVFEDVQSPSHSSSASDSTSSRYTSALNLYEMDKTDDEESDEDDDYRILESVQEDEMIDSKADQFIAQFYQQMKIQNYNEKLRRSGHRRRRR